VRQLGTDRVIDIALSDGLFHIFLEFFAGGNIIITDAEYKIIALFRQVPASGDQEEVKIGLQYAVEKAQYYDGVPSLSPERLRETLQSVAEAAKKSENVPKKSKKKVDVFRKALSHGFPEFPPMLLEDAFAATGFDSSVPLDRVLEDQQLFQNAMNVLEEAERVIKHISTRDNKAGYIVAVEDTKKKPSDQSEESASANNLLYEDFHPFRPRQFEGKPGYKILEYDSFNKTVDEYFSSIESQKLESRLTEHEAAAKRKLDAARADHQKRTGVLKQAQELHIRKAQAIQANVYRVQEAMDAVNGLIAQGMDWIEIARLIEMEQGRNNPVAQIIKLPLKLHENVVTLILSEGSEDDGEEDEDSDFDSEESDEESDSESAPKQRTVETLTIDIDLALSPWSNATQYYDQKKVAAVKEQRTLQSSEKALKSQEKKVTQDLKRNLKQEKQVLRPSRKAFWFEKFLFFISTDGYLVLGGRDAHQVEILYRRYLKKGDIFVNADLEGAIPMIIKNKEETPDAPIPPGTLAQAGSLCVATSKAWDSKALMPSWWAHANQVSKTNERGEIIASGGFHIKGEKNFLAPAQPILGFAVLFQISKESISNHRKHRLDGPSSVEETDAVIPDTQKVETGDQSDASEDAPEVEEEDEDEAVNEAVEAATESKVNPDEEDQTSDVENGEEETPRANPLQTATNKGAPRDEEDTDDDDGDEGEVTETTADTPIEILDKKHKFNTARSNTPTPSQVSSTKQTATNTTRGKKGKAKKAAQKYAHQDEEDRELALRLLGSNANANKAAEAAAAKAKQEADLEAQRRRRRAQHERAAQAERKRQQQFRENGEEGGEGGADDEEETARNEAEDMSWLPALVGTPLPEDEVLAALPVAAPWPALARFKYRAKLQPGNVKKGKAIKEILGHWIIEAGGSPDGGKTAKKVIADDVAEGMERATAERMRAHEAGLLKGWRDVEVMNTLPVGKVRIVSGGSATAGGGGGGGGKGGGNKGGGGAKGDKGGKSKGGGPQKGGKGGKKK
jgi:predicted ribosome quality control (RQC) complex YloA/Tae2 family protein